MRYLVTARVKPGRAAALADAIDDGTLGQGSVAGDEYLRNMSEARQLEDGRVKWVEVCYCPTPLQEEREYWEEYFVLEKGPGRARPQPLQGLERHRAVVVRRLRLHGATRSPPRAKGCAVPLAPAGRQRLTSSNQFLHDHERPGAGALALFDHEKAAVGRLIVVTRGREPGTTSTTPRREAWDSAQ
jgi:hypothetical protein